MVRNQALLNIRLLTVYSYNRMLRIKSQLTFVEFLRVTKDEVQEKSLKVFED